MIPLAPAPLIAILRGVKPDEAEAIASVIVEAGFGGIEVPLNSPNPLKSVEIIARRLGRARSWARGPCSSRALSKPPPPPAQN